MNELFEIVGKLEKIRKLHQFLFIAPTYPKEVYVVREKVLEFKNKNSDVKEIDFIIQSGGGSPDDAFRIIRTLRKNFEKINVIVPFWAKSAATLLSLGGSTIIMDEFAEFGPLDMQLKKETDEISDETQSALLDEHSLNRIEKRAQELFHSMFIDLLESRDVRIQKSKLSEQLLSYISAFYRPLLEKINPYEVGAKARYLAIGEKYAERILIQFNEISKKDRDDFVDYIVHECPDHGYIIDFDLISKFLSNVKKSSEIGKDYCETLTKLSLFFLKSDIELKKVSYIGFFDKSFLEEKKENEKTDKANKGNGEIISKKQEVHI